MILTTCRSVCHANRRERLIKIVAVAVVAAVRMCRVRWSPQPLMHTSAWPITTPDVTLHPAPLAFRLAHSNLAGSLSYQAIPVTYLFILHREQIA